MKNIKIKYCPILFLLALFAACVPMSVLADNLQQTLMSDLNCVYSKVFNLATESLKETDAGTIEALMQKFSSVDSMNSGKENSIVSKKKYLKKLILKESVAAKALLENQLSGMDNAALLRLKSKLEAIEEYMCASQGVPSTLPKGAYPVSEAVLKCSFGIEATTLLSSFLLISDLLAHNIDKSSQNYADSAEELKFLRWKDVKSQIDNLVKTHPSIVRLYSLGKTLEGRDIPLLKISDKVQIDENEPEILYTAGMHPREQQPVVCLMSFLEDLLTKYGKDKEITKLVNEREIWLIPLLNVDGRIYDFRRGMTAKLRNNWRKNCRRNPDGTRGVDINRNFPVRWVRDTKNCSREDYPGSGPASEPETKALMKFIASHKLSMYVDLHSYMGANIVPRYISDPEAVVYTKILRNIEKLQKDPYKYKKPQGSEVPAPKPTKGAGLGFVWAYYTQGIRSINIEVEGDGFYHTVSSSKQEYEANIRLPLIYLAQMCVGLKMPLAGSASLNNVASNKIIKPGALISLKTEINGDFDYAVLVSHSEKARILSEYRLDPSLNGFTVKIMPNTPPKSSVPMTLHTWDSNRGHSVIDFDLKIN